MKKLHRINPCKPRARRFSCINPRSRDAHNAPARFARAPAAAPPAAVQRTIRCDESNGVTTATEKQKAGGEKGMRFLDASLPEFTVTPQYSK